MKRRLSRRFLICVDDDDAVRYDWLRICRYVMGRFGFCCPRACLAGFGFFCYMKWNSGGDDILGGIGWCI
jgi:hypothetical protein